MSTIRFYAIGLLAAAGYAIHVTLGVAGTARPLFGALAALLLATSVCTWLRVRVAPALYLVFAVMLAVMGIGALVTRGFALAPFILVASGLVAAPGYFVLRRELARLDGQAGGSEDAAAPGSSDDDEYGQLLLQAAQLGDDDPGEKQRIFSVLREKHLEMISEHAGQVCFEGGPGDSIATAVVIRGAANQAVGINAEYRYLEGRFGVRGEDWDLVRQRLDTSVKGRICDVLQVRLGDGTSAEVHFDIGEFFGGGDSAVSDPSAPPGP